MYAVSTDVVCINTRVMMLNSMIFWHSLGAAMYAAAIDKDAINSSVNWPVSIMDRSGLSALILDTIPMNKRNSSKFFTVPGRRFITV